MGQQQLGVGGLGLTSVPLDVLKKALSLLHQGILEAPVGAAGLATAGFQDFQEPFLSTLRGLDRAGVKAVLVAVIAERLA